MIYFNGGLLIIHNTVVAFCPGHISGYFKRVEGSTSLTTGSIGAGIVISEGVTTSVVPAKAPSIEIRHRAIDRTVTSISADSPPLTSLMERLGVTASVTTECHLPIGAGFGLSAAALLATATALNRLFKLGLTPRDIARYSHEIEVEHRTGLGDVAAAQAGGRVVRQGPGIDARIERYFDLPEPLYSVSFGPIHTPTVLGSPARMEQVSRAFPSGPPADARDFFTASKQFAEKSGLITDPVQKVFRACEQENVLAGMTMLGDGVFAYGKLARDVLLPFGEVYEFRVSPTGPEILEERA
ncbi:MAG: pantoate kinase [Methanoregula sp.]|nr:pantoate kinase [Methanoregula sp.]